MNERWKYNPGALLCLPLTLVYALQCLIVYRAHSWRWIRGRIECIAGTVRDERNGEALSEEIDAIARRMRGEPAYLRPKDITRIWGRPNGQNIGGRVIVYDSHDSRGNAHLRHHELVHTVQGETWAIAGLAYAVPLAWFVHWSLIWAACLAFPVAYGIGFALKYRTLNFWRSYRANWAEVAAYDEMKTIEPGEWQ